MFQIEDKAIKRLEKDLSVMASRALPFATRQTLNDTAFQTQRIARTDVRNEMTLRNRFTEQSIQVERERRELNIRKQQATVGSTADYMEDQEFGAIKTKRGKNGVAIATAYSAGQEGQQPRTRLPRRANKLASIRLSKRRTRGASKRQENFVKVKQAAESGQKYVFLNLRRGKGIFRVLGGKRRPRIKMVHDLSRQSVVIPRNPWLTPAVAEASRMIPAFYADALRFQLRRLGLFNGR